VSLKHVSGIKRPLLVLCSIIAVAITGCGETPPPELPESGASGSLPNNNNQNQQGQPSVQGTQQVSADAKADQTEAKEKNVGADVGSEEEKTAVKECIAGNGYYDRSKGECDNDGWKPVMDFIWDIDGIIAGLGLQSNEEQFRGFFAEGGEFENYLIDQVVKDEQGKVHIRVVQDNGGFLTLNELVIGS